MENIICKIDLYKVLPGWLLRDLLTNYKSISEDYVFTMVHPRMICFLFSPTVIPKRRTSVVFCVLNVLLKATYGEKTLFESQINIRVQTEYQLTTHG